MYIFSKFLQLDKVFLKDKYLHIVLSSHQHKRDQDIEQDKIDSSAKKTMRGLRNISKRIYTLYGRNM